MRLAGVGGVAVLPASAGGRLAASRAVLPARHGLRLLCSASSSVNSCSRSNFSMTSHSGKSSPSRLVELIEHVAIVLDVVEDVVAGRRFVVEDRRELVDHQPPLGEALLVELLGRDRSASSKALRALNMCLAGVKRVGRLLEVGPSLPVVVVGVALVVDRELQQRVLRARARWPAAALGSRSPAARGRSARPLRDR